MRPVMRVALALLVVLVVLLVAALLVRISTNHPSENPASELTPSTGAATAQAAAPLGQRSKTSGCVIRNDLPDPACTPGAVFAGVTKEQVCTPGYASSVRDVPEAEKAQVYAEYGIRSHREGAYEVDHLVSLELGGSNDIANLWPEAAEPRPGFHEKDRYENYLHDQVCAGRIGLQEAQRRIAQDWLQYWTAAGEP